MNFKYNIAAATTYVKNNNSFVIIVYLYLLVLSYINTVVTWSLTPGGTETTLFAFLMELLQMLGIIVLLKHIFSPHQQLGFFKRVWEAICDAPLFLFYNIVVGLQFLFGLILLIIPGFYFLSRVYFAPYLSIVGEVVEENIDRSYLDWSKELTKDKIPMVLTYIVLFNFLPMALFAPMAWLELGANEKIAQLIICPMEMGIIVFGELVFIHFFKDTLESN